MAITLADFNKIWASTSPLTPYSFSESNYKQGWNFIGSTPPARQMWDFLQKQNDEKMQYLANNYLPLTGGTMTGTLNINYNTSSYAATGAAIKLSGSAQNFLLTSSDTSVTKGTAPSAIKYWGIDFYGKDNGNVNNRIGLFETSLTPSNIANATITAYGCSSLTNNVTCSVSCHIDVNDYRWVSSNNDNAVDLGSASQRWKQLFAGTTTIATSDERLKDNIEAIPDDVLDAWGEVNWYQYQFKDSIEEKGETKARLHTGAIAQRIENVFESHNLDANRYGLLCYDEWEAEEEQKDSEGNIVQEAREAGNRYSLRYEEALCMEAAYQRRRADRLEERIEALEKLLMNRTE